MKIKQKTNAVEDSSCLYEWWCYSSRKQHKGASKQIKRSDDGLQHMGREIHGITKLHEE